MTRPEGNSDDLTSSEARVFTALLGALHEDVADMKRSLVGINETLIKLAGLEVQHIATKEALHRAFESIGKTNDRLRSIDERLQKIEVRMPGLIEARAGVVALCVGAFVVIALALTALVVRPMIISATPAVQSETAAHGR